MPTRPGPLLQTIGTLLLLFVIGAWTWDARGDLWTVKGEPAAFWIFDPMPMIEARAARDAADGARADRGWGAPVSAALRAAVNANLVGDDTGAWVLSSILALDAVGNHPHRIVLMSVDAAPAGPDGGVDVRDLQAVLEVKTDHGHDELLRTLSAILVRGPVSNIDPEPGAPGQRRLDLPASRTGVAFRREGWEAWRTVSWCSEPGRFTIGVGEGALERWFLTQGASWRPSPTNEWIAHATEVSGGIDAPPGAEGAEVGRTVARAFVDLNALRRAFPDAFIGESRPRRLLRGWGLSNARGVMYHARWMPETGDDRPPLVAMDVTWSARSEPPGRVRRRVVSRPSWPVGEPLPFPRGGSYAVVMRSDLWPVVATQGGVVDTYLNSRTFLEERKDRIEYRRWLNRNIGAFRRVLEGVGPWIVLTDVPRPPVAVPGVTSVYAPLKPQTNRARFERDLRVVMAPLGERVLHDDAMGGWSFRLLNEQKDPRGFLRIGSWGLVERGGKTVFVLGWGPGVLASD